MDEALVPQEESNPQARWPSHRVHEVSRQVLNLQENNEKVLSCHFLKAVPEKESSYLAAFSIGLPLESRTKADRALDTNPSLLRMNKVSTIASFGGNV